MPPNIRSSKASLKPSLVLHQKPKDDESPESVQPGGEAILCSGVCPDARHGGYSFGSSRRRRDQIEGARETRVHRQEPLVDGSRNVSRMARRRESSRLAGSEFRGRRSAALHGPDRVRCWVSGVSSEPNAGPRRDAGVHPDRVLVDTFGSFVRFEVDPYSRGFAQCEILACQVQSAGPGSTGAFAASAVLRGRAPQTRPRRSPLLETDPNPRSSRDNQDAPWYLSICPPPNEYIEGRRLIQDVASACAAERRRYGEQA